MPTKRPSSRNGSGSMASDKTPLPFLIVRSKMPAYVHAAVNLKEHDGYEIRGSGYVEQENGECFVELRREQVCRVPIPRCPVNCTESNARRWYDAVLSAVNNKMIDIGWAEEDQCSPAEPS